MPDPLGLGGGVFIVTNLFFTESQSFVRYSSIYKIYYVCSIKLETKVCKEFGFRRVNCLFVNKYAVHDF